jgi:hypothetical protein
MALVDNYRNLMTVHLRTNVPDGLHGGVDCQGLGNLLSCFWTEVVVPKAAETGEKMHTSAK